MILVFIFFTSPTSTHALAKAALFAGIRPLISPPEKQEKNKDDGEDASS